MTSPGKLLLYCVLEKPKQDLASAGVADQPIHHLDVEQLTALYSGFARARNLDQQDALRFHQVLKSAFDHQAIIPFRFPTWLETETELRDHLRDNHQNYAADLDRLRDFVQMELRIVYDSAQRPTTSGKEYLEAKLQRSQRLQAAARAARDSAADLISDSKERQSDDGLRLYALIDRKGAALFRERIQSLQPASPLTILVSGPWPATEFLHD
jgi:hypothetical protein